MKYLSITFLLIFSIISCTKTGKKSDGFINSKNQISNDTANLKWVDYRYGELPPEGYYDAFDSIIKKWEIKYERIEGGCEINEALSEKKKYEKDNAKYFAELEKKFGKDWRKKFDAEVEEMELKLNKNK